MYADWTYYSETYGGSGAQAEVEPLLERASDDIDNLTLSRICAIGWDKLTDFQRSKIQRACCIQADFLRENADAVESAFKEYAINGVKMVFGNDALYKVIDGVAMSNAAYALLKQTGLTSLFAYPQEVDHALA